MSQPPSSWDPNAGQQDYSQGQYGGSGGYGQQPSYSPPPQYGGYPPAETQQQYGQQPYGYGQPAYPPQYGTPYGASSGPQRPGAALAAAVLSYIQAGIVLICSFFVLAAGTEVTELLLIGIVQLVSVGLLIFGAVQITSGSGRNMMIAACVLQLLLVLYYLIRIASLDELDAADTDGAVVIPLFFAVMPAVALALVFNRMVSQFIAAKSGQPSGGNQQQWGQ
ncbi:MAG: hypothetical protein H0T66_02645 [Geodermatophilaceae bacterium]|nr:hypothetical protein [Geodermatophilaceae bacterium]MDQ3456097.1 hypothetical protein [Actinomycetota bacterium]